MPQRRNYSAGAGIFAMNRYGIQKKKEIEIFCAYTAKDRDLYPRRLSDKGFLIVTYRIVS